jgi:hypothetical protein
MFYLLVACTSSAWTGAGAMAKHVQDIEFILSVHFSLSARVLTISLFLVANKDRPNEPQDDGQHSSSAGDGSCLVRIPIDELQTSKPVT